MGGYRVLRKDYDWMFETFLSEQVFRPISIRGCSDLDIELRIQDRTAKMTRSEASTLFQELSRKLLSQEYLKGVSQDQIVEDLIPAAEGSVDAQQDA